jgi:inorganic pyrophosphatase/exopolyphosphatase
MVTSLALQLGMSDIDVREMAKGQFKAKSAELAALPASELVGMDQKTFFFETPAFTGTIGFAVLETVDTQPLLDKKTEILAQLTKEKGEKKLDALMLAVVDIVKLNATLILCGDNERSLAGKAFGKEVKGDTLELPGLVSRKKDFVPAVDKAVNAGWSKK